MCSGENVTFVWDGKFHNVNELRQEDWEECKNFTNPNPDYATYEFQAPSTQKTYYFACGVGDGFHCKTYKMKAKVIVSENCAR